MVHPVLQSLGNAERGTGVPVVLLTGVDRLSLDAVAFSLADSCPSVCSITYDVRPNAAVESGLDIVRMVTRPHVNGLAFGETDSFGLEECCMSCTVKHDVGRVLESMCSALLSGPSELPESSGFSGFSESGSAEVGESLSPAGTGEFGVLAGVGVGKESTSGNSEGESSDIADAADAADAADTTDAADATGYRVYDGHGERGEGQQGAPSGAGKNVAPSESMPAPMPAAFLISLPVGLEGAPVAQYLSDLFDLDDWGMPLYVGDVANVVGLDEFEEWFFDDDRLCLYGLGGPGEEDAVYDERSTGAVVSRLIREASCILELPVVGAGCLSRHLDAAGECRCREIIRAVAEPDAVVYEDARAAGIRDLPHCSVSMKMSMR
ncbi:hypothetical protein BG22_03495 [Bifidobacterium sp. UTBIF-78]|nr:hypothetical protein BG22_03495 [Bifidobacterium sp. UTBIF-78]